jgi:tRNA pseudouridine32 synthase/23S rRNA pseudouridine746 synthase
LHLHSRGIVLPLSKNKPAVVVTAPPPPHMQERLRACGFTPAT